MKKNRFSAYVSSILLLAVLTSCSNKPLGIEVCPDVAFLDGLDQMTFFKDETSADISNVLFSSKMKQLDFDCSFGAEGAEVEVTFTTESRLALVKKETLVEVAYFIAAVNPNGKILAKRAFNTDILFSPKKLIVIQEETVNPFFPSRTGNDFTGYKVLIGFQLTKNQVNFNLQNRRLIN
jgi:hypothetical protein